MLKTKVCCIDFETYSDKPIKYGAARYAQDESTEVLCLAYCFDFDIKNVKLWHPDLSPPQDLLDHVVNGGLIRAWNVSFEYFIWNYTCTRLYDWPKLNVDSCLCSMTDALALALPGSLAECGEVLNVEQKKDTRGNWLIRNLCMPRVRPTKALPGTRLFKKDHPDLFEELYNYCIQDVISEVSILLSLPRHIKGFELEMFRKTLEINERGITIDTSLVDGVIRDKDNYEKTLNEEVKEITNGLLSSTNSRVQSMKWLADNGVILKGYTKSDIKKALNKKIPGNARRFLEIRSELSRTPVKKYDFLQNAICSDGTIKNNLIFHKATTGRYCVDTDTEVLTEHGWTNVFDWDGDDIAVWSPSGEVFFDKVKINIWPYEGDLIEIKNRFCQIQATPEHCIPYFSSTDKFFTILAKDVVGRGLTKIIHGGLSEQKGNDIVTRVLTMTQADGCFRKTRDTQDLVFTFIKERKVERCEELLNLAGINYRKVKYSNDKVNIKVKWRDLPKWLSDFQDKDFSMYSFQDLNLYALMNEIPFWDGHKYEGQESFEYSTTIKNNAEFVATAAHLTNMSARIVLRERHEKWNTNYRVYIRPTYYSRLTKTQSRTIKFKGQVFCPETTTGFFLYRKNGLIGVTGNSGTGFQIQNISRSQAENPKELIAKFHNNKSIENRRVIDEAISLLRNSLIATPGYKMVVSDFSGIENRVVSWLAGDEQTLHDFENGIDQYKTAASSIFKIGYDEVTKEQRQLGKISVLSCCFGGGYKTFHKVCNDGWGIPINEDLAEQVVQGYRNKYKKIVKLWYGLIDAMEKAITYPGVFSYRDIKFRMKGDFVYMRLPNGRLLAYYKPKMQMVLTPWGEKRLAVTHLGTNTYTRKWERLPMTHGRLTENATQAVARDILNIAVDRAEKRGFKTVGLVHDEIITQVKLNNGLGIEQLNEVMEEKIDWCRDLPINAEGFEGERYKK